MTFLILQFHLIFLSEIILQNRKLTGQLYWHITWASNVTHLKYSTTYDLGMRGKLRPDSPDIDNNGIELTDNNLLWLKKFWLP